MTYNYKIEILFTLYYNSKKEAQQQQQHGNDKRI